MTGRTPFWPVGVLAIAAAAIACKPNVFPGPKGPPPDETPPPTTSAPVVVAAPVATPSPPPTASAPTTTPPPPPPPPVAAPAPVLDPAIETGIKAAAARHARGMQPEGAPITGELKQGEHLDTMVTLESSKCYAIIGFSPPNAVRNIKLRLLVGPAYAAAAAEGAIIGKGGPLCPPGPMTYKLDIAALKGAGKIGAQLYSKPK